MSNAIKVEVVFQHQDGLPKDEVVNQFIFATTATPSAGGSAETQINAAIIDFYNTVDTGTSRSIANVMSDEILRTATARMNYTDISAHLDGSPAGSPYQVDIWSLAAKTAGTVDLPSEVALVLTYESIFSGVPEFGPGHTRPRARHRGRLYLGPLTAGMAGVGSDFVYRPGATMCTMVGAAAGRLRNLATTSSGLVAWAQWSRKDLRVSSVASGWVDDSWDTQRRRGAAPLNRHPW